MVRVESGDRKSEAYVCMGVNVEGEGGEQRRGSSSRREGSTPHATPFVGVRRVSVRYPDEETAACFRPILIDCWSRMAVSAESIG